MYKKILVPLDGSALAEAVLPHAQALAKSEGAEIVLLSVPVVPNLEFLARSPGLANQVIEASEKETEEYLIKEEAKLTNGNVCEFFHNFFSFKILPTLFSFRLPCYFYSLVQSSAFDITSSAEFFAFLA